MNVLGIYANGERLQVALAEVSDHINIIQSYDEPIPMGQLIPRLGAMLKQVFDLKPDIDIIACPKGPGAFTSLRVILSTVQGIAMGMNAKVFAPTTFDVLALAQSDLLAKGPAWVLIDSRSDFFYARYYPTVGQAEEPLQILKVELGDYIKVTDYVVTDIPVEGLPVYQHPSLAEVLCMMDLSHAETFKQLRPFYMHVPNYKKKVR